jgi:hypothetical protein
MKIVRKQTDFDNERTLMKAGNDPKISANTVKEAKTKWTHLAMDAR